MKKRSYYLTLALLALLLLLGAYLLISGAREAQRSLRLPRGGSEAIILRLPCANRAG